MSNVNLREVQSKSNLTANLGKMRKRNKKGKQKESEKKKKRKKREITLTQNVSFNLCL